MKMNYFDVSCIEILRTSFVMLTGEDMSKRANLDRLWSYECDSTRGLSVTCMVWNRSNPDLLAVGYSKNGCMENGPGLLCVWSVNNPEHPERMYTPTCAVTAVDFSNSRPYLLAAGGTWSFFVGNLHDRL